MCLGYYSFLSGIIDKCTFAVFLKSIYQILNKQNIRFHSSSYINPCFIVLYCIVRHVSRILYNEIDQFSILYLVALLAFISLCRRCMWAVYQYRPRLFRRVSRYSNTYRRSDWYCYHYYLSICMDTRITSWKMKTIFVSHLSKTSIFFSENEHSLKTSIFCLTFSQVFDSIVSLVVTDGGNRCGCFIASKKTP